MESRRPSQAAKRTRTKNLVIRLSDRERTMLDAVAAHEQLTVSETVRWLVRREFDSLAAAKPGRGRSK